MNKVVTINLGGTAYQLEEGGYDLLRAYLETADKRLQPNPDREEILSDIEWAIAEKFRALLCSNKTVVVEKEVATVLAEMGPIEAGPGESTDPGGATGPGTGPTAGTGGANPFDAHRETLGSLFGRKGADPGGTGGAGAKGGAGTAGEEHPPGDSAPPKRLYRLPDGSMIAGVCNGLGAYLHIDPTFLRLAFVLAVMVFGTGVLVYIILAIVVPEAHTPEEKAAATGDPSTTQDFIRRAREGYYGAMKGFPDRRARREWKRRFKREMRAHAWQWRHNWHQNWGGWDKNAPIPPGMGFTLPMISLLYNLIRIAWICALVSLLATGDIFGMSLPEKVPVWLAVVGLFVVYGIFVEPLKMARRACHWGIGQSRPAWSLIFLTEGVVGVAMFVVLLLLACHFFPEVRAAIHSIPETVHQAATDMENWWKGR